MSGPVSEQGACHASAQRRVCPLLPDVMLSAAKHLGAPRARCFAALSMTMEEALSPNVCRQVTLTRRNTPGRGTFASPGTSSLLEASGSEIILFQEGGGMLK